MNTWQGLNKRANTIEWRLLIFLLLFMDVKLVVKLAALILVFIFQPGFRFGFRLKETRLPLFYLAVICIAVLNWLIYRDFTFSYSMLTLTGIIFWLACILAIHQVKLFVERTDLEILHNTLTLFFILNIAASLLNVAIILTETGLRNPFLYQGNYQKYFINTGDHIKGITFDSSTTNAMINAFGVVYFLYRKRFALCLACMVILIIAVSNIASVILMAAFAGIFIFKSSADQKTIMAVCVFMLVIFFAKLSPQNDNYINETFNKYILKKERKTTTPVKTVSIREQPDSLLDDEGKKEKIATLYLDSVEREIIKKETAVTGKGIPFIAEIKERPEIPGDSIHTASFQWKRDTTGIQREIISYVDQRGSAAAVNSRYTTGLPGKLVAFKESFDFLKKHPGRVITGDGVGKFSSKLTFRATGLKIAGGYPQRMVFSHEDFLDNHFGLYTFFFTKNAGSHSLLNSPASVYDQLLMEYGLLGLAAFFLLYTGFFLKRSAYLSYGIPLLAMMLAAFVVDYWFEQLSVVLLFELMMFIDIKENRLKQAHA